MLTRLTFLLLASLPLLATAQNVGINANGAAPNGSAILDIDASAMATKGGLLIPRMTTVDRNAIIGPATSLLIFNTTAQQFEYFDGLFWRGLLTTASAGWALGGNSGTTPGVNFIGTTDNAGLRFRVNNQHAGLLDPSLSNTSFGINAGTANSGSANTFIGSTAGPNNLTGNQNTIMGFQAGNGNQSGNNNTFIGVNAGFSNATASDNTYIGKNAGQGASGTSNTSVGLGSGPNSGIGGGNSFFGVTSGAAVSSGNANTFIGGSSGTLTTIGSGNTFLGSGTGGTNTTGSSNTLLGSNAQVNGVALTNASAVGSNARVDASNALVLGSVNGVNSATATATVGIGTTNPLDRLHVVGSIRMVDGNQALGRVMVSNANGTASWVDPLTIASGLAWTLTGNALTNPATNFLGTTDAQPLRLRTGNAFAGQLSNTGNGMVSYGLGAGAVNTGTNNTFIGSGAGAANVASGNNTYVGTNAGGANTNGQQNVFIGRLAGGNGNTGSDNIIIGNGAGLFNTANNNVMIGSFSGNANSTGGGNTFMGTQSGQGTTTGGQNTFLGTGAGSTNTIGQQNTLIGNSASVGANNLVNATAIGRGSQVDASDALVLGSVSGVNGATATSKVGIGTTNPLDRLHVVGSIRMVDGNQAPNKVMVSDANGTASWQALGVATTNAWGLVGNTATNPVTNFIGTTDNQPLMFRTNNSARMRITNTGVVEVGGAAVVSSFSSGIARMLVASEVNNEENLTVWAAHNTAAGRASLTLARQRGSFATTTAVANGDGLGEVVFDGMAASPLIHLPAAMMFADVDGAPTMASVPGKLGFSTTPVGSSAPLERMTIRSTGLVGIGTTNPARLLHVSAGTSGATSNGNAKLVLEDNADTYAHFLTPTANESGLLFGNASGSIRAGFIFNSGVPDGLDFRTGGNNARMAIDAGGDVGIGTLGPNRHLEIAGTGVQTVRINSTTATDTRLEFMRLGNTNADWALVSKSSGFALVTSGDDYTTEFDEAVFTGASFRPGADLGMSLGTAAFRYTTVFAQNGTINTSDVRDKTAIEEIHYGLDQVMRMHPVSFRWKTAPEEGTKLGLIAQEIQQVVPEVVRDWDWKQNEDGTREKVLADRLGVFYSDLIPVLVKAIQEQQGQIERLAGQLEALRSE